MKRFILTFSIVLAFFTLGMVSAAPTGGSTAVEVGNPTSADWIGLFAYIIIALLFSFLCSIAEAVLLNITPSYMADLQEKDPKFAKKVIKVRETDVENSLAAILTTNTIAHTVGAVGSGAKAAIVFGSAWLGLFSGVMTILILIFSEIIPKTVGVVFWKKLVKWVIRYIDLLSFVLGKLGVLWLLAWINQKITKDKSHHSFNRDEFVAMANVGFASGALTDRESRIIKNLFQLGSLTAKDVYTPRTVMMAFDQNLTVSDVYKVNDKLSFSRLLIYEGDVDNITGFVLKDDLLLLESEDKGDTKLHKIHREILAIPINTSLSKVLEILLQKKQHIAIVVDEFGTKGLITVEDLLETLLGIEIVDESDSVPDMQELAKQLWKKRMESFGIAIPEEANPYAEVGEKELEVSYPEKEHKVSDLEKEETK